MQLIVKTLKGEKFTVNAEPSNTIAEVKTIIETEKSELPAANMKLIHSGKVLKDDATIESCNIKPSAFLVVMISKAKKTAAPAPAAPAPAPSETTTTTKAASSSTTSAPTSSATTATATATESAATTPPAANTSTTTTSTESSAPAAAPAPSTTSATTSSTDSFSPEMVANLTAMGFPEAEVRACLRASQGNPDVAVEYLMNGIPPFAQQLANASNAPAAPSSSATSGAGSSSSSSSSSSEPLAALRNHPQINQLRQLVQSNPSTLQAVLTQIGQQQPELLQEINSNQELFLQIMNEPVGTGSSGSGSSAPAPAPASSSTTSSNPISSGGGGGGPGAASMLEGMNNPAQMAQMIQNMTPEQLHSMAAMMGLSPDQLAATAQLISRMPQEDFEQYLNMAMQGGGAGGMSSLMGGAGGPGGDPSGAQVLRLTEEEMAAVDRLADMGFDRTEAAQAYLACDKNEALAANLLMDGGWGAGDVDMGGSGGGAGGSGNNGGNDGDDMYD